MRKIYSVATLLFVALISFCAAAQQSTDEDAFPRTLKFNCDDRVTIEVGAPDGVKHHPTDGKFEITIPAENIYQTIKVYSENPDVTVKSISASDGTTVAGNEGAFSIYPQAYEAEVTFTVEITEVDIDNAFTIIVDQPSKVTIRRQGGSYETIPMIATQFDVPVSDIADANTIMIESTSDNPIYNVTKNGKKASSQANGRRWEVTKLAAGDVVKITVETPEIMVPVKFTGKTDAIASVSVTGKSTSEWNKDDFQVKLNSKLSISYKPDWKIIRVEMNGTRVSAPENMDIVSEKETTIEVFAEQLKKVNVTFKCDDFDKVSLSSVLNGVAEKVDLTAAETTFEVNPNSQLNFSAAAGYFFSAFADNQEGEYSLPATNMYVYLEDKDITLTAGVTKLERNDEFTLYVEDGNWENVTCMLQNNAGGLTYTAGTSPTTGTDVKTLAMGYNHIAFCDADNVMVSGYINNGMPVVYLNGTLVGDQVGGLSDLKNGDVVKVFAKTPASYSVTYAIQEETKVEVVHDVKSVVDNPASHTVFHGTDIIIRRAANAARSEEAKPLEVNVNGEQLTAEADGSFHIVATQNLEIKVTDPMVAGIGNVAVDGEGEHHDIFNLQGIRVGNTADDSALPAGVYIVNGKKIRY